MWLTANFIQILWFDRVATVSEISISWLVHSVPLRICMWENGLKSGIKARKCQPEKLPMSGTLCEFKTALWLKSGLVPKNLSPGVKWREGVVFEGFERHPAGFKCWCFFFLKEASSRNKIQKPVNLQHNDSGVSRLPIQATWTIPQYVCELMNYSGSYANRTMKRDTVHVLRVCLDARVCFSGSVRALRWELGNLLTLVLCSSQSEK